MRLDEAMPPAAGFAVVELEPALAARSGLPERLAVPHELAVAREPLDRGRVASWAAEFVRTHPEHPLADSMTRLAAAEPYRRLGERLLEVGRHEDAARALARAVELAPFDAASRFNRAVALRRDGRLEDALSALDEIEWAYGGEAGYLVARGGLLETLDEPERAVVEYERALARLPGDDFVLGRLEALGALVRLEGPDGEPYWLTPADFERVVRSELAENAANAGHLVGRGEWLEARGHHDLARAAAELALTAMPHAAPAWALLGRLRRDAAEPDARAAFEQAAALDGSRVDVARALVLDPQDPEGDLLRAQIHARRRAASAAAWLVLGDVLDRDGSSDDALAAYRQALALDPELVGAAHARAAVDRSLRS